MALSKLDVADLVEGPNRVVDRGPTNLEPVAEDVLDDDRGIVDEDADCEDQREQAEISDNDNVLDFRRRACRVGGLQVAENTMVFDTLTIIGLLMVVPYALLPLLFGRELIRVVEDSADDTSSGAAPSPPSLSTPSVGRRWFGLLLLGWRESPFVLR